MPFAGYNMPILYEGVNAEHETVRNDVGVLMFRTWENSCLRDQMLWLYSKVTSNDASVLTVGEAQYSCLQIDGGVVDDLIIYKMKEEQYLLVVNASNIEKTGIGFRLIMIWVST
jgi:aminomethyltransferase